MRPSYRGGALAIRSGHPRSGSVELLFPAGLAAGLLAVPLVALYFLRLRRRRVEVPSLLPWHVLQRSEQLASPFHRFRRHRLLLLQLLALAALVLALARPATHAPSGPSRAEVHLVDTSASMGATDGAPTRLADAVSAASGVLDELGPTDDAMLVVAGARTEVAVPFTRDPAEIRGALGRLAPTDAEGDLGEGLDLALSLSRARPAVEVDVFSDGAGADLRGVAAGDADIRYVPVGRDGTNCGIVALDLRRATAGDLSAQVFASVENAGPADVDATVECWLGSQMLGVKREHVASGATAPVVFDLPATATGSLELRLDSPGDLLPADDRAYAVVEAVGRRRLALVGGDSLTARVLDADPRVRLERIAPADATAANLSAMDAIIFGAPVPDGLDGRSYLVLGPRFGGPVAFGTDREAPRVVGWNRGHPLLRATHWDAVHIARSSSVSDAGGLSAVVDGDEGPLVLAGERSGGRVAVLAFDPFESDLPLRVGWPVLLLDAVGWLTERGGAEGSGIATGDTFMRRVDAPAAHIDGPGGAVDLPVEEGVLRFGQTDRAGIYQVGVGSLKTAFAANLTSERETRIAPRRTLPVGGGPAGLAQAGIGSGRAEWWRACALVGLAVLAVEWLVWALGRRA
jgi:hypothetical protein